MTGKPDLVRVRDVQVGVEQFADGTGCVYLKAVGHVLRFDPRSAAVIGGKLASATFWFADARFKGDPDAADDLG